MRRVPEPGAAAGAVVQASEALSCLGPGAVSAGLRSEKCGLICINMCIRMQTYIYVYTYVGVYIHICTYVHTLCMFMGVCVCIESFCVCVFVCTCFRVRMRVCGPEDLQLRLWDTRQGLLKGPAAAAAP